jgi:endoglucanase
MRRLWAIVAVCLLAPAGAGAQDLGAPAGESAAAAARAGTRVLLGIRTASARALTVPAGTLEAVRFVPARTGRVDSLSLLLGARSRARWLALGLYGDRAGHPGALITGAPDLHPRPGRWNRVPVPPRTVRAHRAYWLAVLAAGGELRLSARRGACRAERAHSRAPRRLPRTFGPGQRTRTCLTALVAAGTIGTSPGGDGSGGSGGRGGAPAATSRPVNVSPPVISGTPIVGDPLTATRGTWTGDPTAFADQWRDCTGSTCTNISGATGAGYLLRSSDAGHQIDVVVTASNAYGATAATSSATATVTPASAAGLHVSGTHLLNASGTVIRLRGVDRAGTEYMCSEGYGIFDGPNGASSTYTAMTAWNINTVFFGVNEDCWLAVNGVKASDAGQTYIDALKAEVALAEKQGLYPVIGFFWGDPGTQVPTGNDPNGGGQPPLPDNDHTPLLWEEIAETFKGDPNVVFRLQEEPHPSASGPSASGASTSGGFGSNLYQWRCWSAGSVQYGAASDSPTWGVAPKPTGSNHNCDEYATDGRTIYQTVGMQSLIDIIRGTGARNVIEVPGLAYANLLSCSPTTAPSSCGFLDSSQGVEVHDTLSPAQLTADVDVYPDANQVCSTTSCYGTTYAPVAAQMPIGAGEVGPNGTTVTKTNQFLDWMDTEGESYDAWVWDTWGSLISNYNGTPDSPWGTDYRARLTG